jgi:acid-sensing ion channel, other
MMLNFPGDRGTPVSTNDYPLKSTQRSGQGLKLSLEKNKKIRHSKICTSLSFMVHSPFEIPGNFEMIDMVDFDYGYDLEVLVTPEIVTTDPGLRSYEPKKRGCYFEGEKKLKYFKVYTRRNCESECLSGTLFKMRRLRCVPYYMARTDSMDYCDYKKEFWMGVHSFNVVRNITGDGIKCGCLDECDSINYKFEVIANNRLNSNKSLKDEKAFVENTIEFKFKDVDVVPLRRYQSFTFTEFLAQSGGMLGLFAGISALSIIELVYFSSLRWMMDLLRWIKRRFCKS